VFGRVSVSATWLSGIAGVGGLLAPLKDKAMKAAKILAGCTYGPEALKIIGKAFDDAWADIAELFAGDRERAVAARERLAHAALMAATEDCQDSELLKNMALRIMALSYRGSWLDPGSKIPDREASFSASLH
jgi:hypothetical protein